MLLNYNLADGVVYPYRIHMANDAYVTESLRTNIRHTCRFYSFLFYLALLSTLRIMVSE
jgi:hypothetical protein